jgi:hypothetical protein
MSDQIFSGGGVATAEPPAEGPEPPPVTGSRRNLVVVAIAVVIALAVAAWFLFLSGGSSSTPAAVVPHATVKANGAGNGKVATVTPSAVAVKPASVRDKKGRDPFQPLLTDAVSSPSPTPTPSASASASVSAPVPTPTPTTPVAGNVVATLSLTSIDSKNKTASFTVASTGSPAPFKAVKVGQTFATFFKLYDLGSKCAQVQYGDLTDSVCMGTPLVVQGASS